MKPVVLTPFLAFFGLLAVGACTSSSQTGAGGEAFPDAAAEASPDLGEEAGNDASTNPDVAIHDAQPDAKKDASILLTDAGCVDHSNVSALCASSGDFCAFSAGCGKSSSIGQCSINCGNSALYLCKSAADLRCLLDAFDAKSCAALAVCNWSL